MRRFKLHAKLPQIAQFTLLGVFALAVTIPFADELYELLLKDPPARILTYRSNPFEIECSSPDTHHGYCPEIIVKREAEIEDGGETFLHYIDQSSIQVRTRAEIHDRYDTAKADMIFLGDSYLQAELVPFDETLTSILGRTIGKNILRVGYNGWTAATEFGWLRSHDLKPGVQVSLFVSADDFMPTNPFSNYRYHQIGTPIEGGGLRFPARSPASPLLASPAWSTALFGPLLPESLGFTTAAAAPLRHIPKPYAERIDREQSDCSKLDQYNYVTARTSDYVAYSFAPPCWSAEQFRNVRSGLSDIRLIHTYVKNLGGTLRVFLIPPAWAFPGEMRLGRNQSVYQIAEGASITVHPLASYLQERLVREGITYYNLEPTFREFKKAEARDLFYPVDGRWTRLTHRMLADWLAKEFSSR